MTEPRRLFAPNVSHETRHRFPRLGNNLDDRYHATGIRRSCAWFTARRVTGGHFALAKKFWGQSARNAPVHYVDSSAKNFGPTLEET
jgi:hypothetical protein